MDDFRFLHDSYLDETTPVVQTLPQIILVEDDKTFGKTIKKFLEKKLNLQVSYFANPSDCLEFMKDWGKKPFCLITDISFDESGTDGLFLIDQLTKENLNFVSIVMTGFASIENAIQATKKGVFNYLTKPFEPTFLCNVVVDGISEKFGIRKELLLSTKEDKSKSNSVFLSKFKVEAPKEEDIFESMIGRSKKMQDVFERIRKVAASDSTVLITGASGTGKELVASAVHNLSNRNSQRQVSVNCGAIPKDLLESELFGHVKGAFTSAVTDRKGKFERANFGTMFLDEIGDMPLLLQVKILRALQNKEIEPVGSSDIKKIDVRVITATHRNLEQAVKDGTFREDLYYRLNVIPISIPSLCERREDIPLLISYFLSKFASADGSNNVEFDEDSLELLISYDWPGNVRELENFIESLVILKGGSLITINDLPAKFFTNTPYRFNFGSELELPEEGIDLKNTLSEIENSLIEQALLKTEGNKNQASQLLSMNRTTLIEKMKKKGISYERPMN